MQVFISWSGDRSRQAAEVLRDHLGLVIQALRPWMSSKDIESGQRWSEEIAAQLDSSNYGICVITRENQARPWLNFEAGAIAKSKGESRMSPLLVDLTPADLRAPLSQFQASEIDKDGMFKLFESLNTAAAQNEKKPLADDALRTMFDAFWARIEAAFAKVLERTAVPPAATPPRPEREILEEVLEIVRDLRRPSAPHTFTVNTDSLADFEDIMRKTREKKTRLILQRMKDAARGDPDAAPGDE